MLISVSQQLIVLLLLFGLADLGNFVFGILQRSCGFALVAYWSACGIIIFRRAVTPSRIDLILIQFGFVPLFGIAFATSKMILICRGFSPRLF